MDSTEEGNIYDYDQDDPQSSSESSVETWIGWFCSLTGHEFYVEVPEEFIDDDFNLTGLSAIVPYYTQALEMILDMEGGEFFDDEDEEEEEESDDNQEYDLSQIENYYNNNKNKEESDGLWKEGDKLPKRSKVTDSRIVEPYAFMLYGLIHQRYLLTRDGLRLMAERYTHNDFGACPRYYCNDSPVLPMGQFDETGRESVHLYCPRCRDIYSPPNTIHQCVDGAHFGSTYLHLLFLTYPELSPSPSSHIYQPSIFGFKVSSLSRSGPRNQWLRKYPQQYTVDDDEENEDNNANQQNFTKSNVIYDSLTQSTNKLHIYDNKKECL